jgi:small ligand-binding sensory domain FIST
MQIASALSTLGSPPALAQDIEGQLKGALSGAPDLLLVFVSYSLVESFEPIVSMIRGALQPRHLLAVAAESILGADQEVERLPGVSALAITCPTATLHAFHLPEDQWAELLTDDEALTERMSPEHTGELRAFVLFADPFSTPVVQLLEACSRRFPAAPVIGGMASGMQNTGDTRLALNGEIHTSGAVGVSFAGDIEVDCVVSQGCRPIGETFVITRCKQNMIEQLDGKPALAAIEEMITQLPLHDRQLLATGGLQIGRVIDQGKGSYGRGDFLIRSLIGVRRETGAILVGDMMKTGQTLQFHVRDAKTADEEMRLLLEGATLLAPTGAQPAGALLITCIGRGTRLFDMPHHDISLTRQVLGSIPIAGFFAAGELGPVGEKNFIHGHTAALAVFREAAAE